MFELNVNGKVVYAETDKPLISFLRDDLKLTSVKDGCSEGACGTCSVLVDGKVTKSCIQKVSRFVGKKILTVEGFDPKEMAVYEYCFGEMGAVQCGFCIPGMIIAAKGLIDVNNDPSIDDIKKAIRGNICRCTGYKKIEEAILLAAKFFREGLEIPEPGDELGMNQRYIRPDAAEKVNGTGLYADDLEFPGMLYAKAVRSKYPRAIVNKIDISKALEHPDCERILLAADVPNNKTGHVKKDWDVMIAEGDITRYVGDALALVASRNKYTLEEIVDLVEVDYTELTPITSPQDALKGDAPLIHKDGNILSKSMLIRGDVDAALKNSKYVVTRKYKTPHQEHAFMEPECAVAVPEGDDGLLLYTGSQSVYDEQSEISDMLQIPLDKVNCHAMLVGGGFGGKEDMSVQHHAALMAWVTKKPVKVKFTRQESLAYHTKRHPMDIEITTGCDENGIIQGMRATLIADTGAYASLGKVVLDRACTHAAGPYNYQNIDILGIAVYTNNMVSGAFRGFGVGQSNFAMEQNLNLLAEKVGISAWEIRYRNAIRPGQILPNGQIAEPNTGAVECLEAVKELYENNPRAGIALAWKNSGKGVGVIDTGRCILQIKDGKVHVLTSAACMGQGIAIMCQTVICETTGISPKLVVHEAPDTRTTPDSGTSTASRQTLVTGEATKRAAEMLKADLDAGKTLADLEGKEYFGEYHPMTDGLKSTKEFPVRHVGYGYGVQVVLIDDEGKVEKVVSAYDVGTPVNIQAVEGQIEGGVIMGLGYALSENFVCEDGYCKTKLGTLGLMRSTDVPEQEVILVQPEGVSPLAYGAKGCGELCMIPTGAACAHAYYKLDGVERRVMPLENTYYDKKRRKK